MIFLSVLRQGHQAYIVNLALSRQNVVADAATPVTDRPQAHEDEVNFILDAISEYLTVKVRRSDVLSTWAGLRPLASDPNAANTESASRDHIVTRDPDGLLTVTGEPLNTALGCILHLHEIYERRASSQRSCSC